MNDEGGDGRCSWLYPFWFFSVLRLGVLGDMLAGRGRLGTCNVLSKLVVFVEFGGMVDH